MTSASARTGDVPAREGVRVDREVANRSRREAVNGRVDAARRRRLPLERPGRTRLDEAEREERAELRAGDQRPVAIGERDASGRGQRGEAGRHEEKTAHVDDLEAGEQRARPASKARRRIAEQTPVPFREPAFNGWR